MSSRDGGLNGERGFEDGPVPYMGTGLRYFVGGMCQNPLTMYAYRYIMQSWGGETRRLKMKRVTFLIPKRSNEGRRFPARVLAEIRRDILEIAGGYTWRDVRGAWYDEDEGKTYQDASWEYTVVMEGAKIGELVRWLEKAKDLLSQQAMWLEIQDVESHLV